jgi:D-alanyl-D-alanine carboxypeptidase
MGDLPMPLSGHRAGGRAHAAMRRLGMMIAAVSLLVAGEASAQIGDRRYAAFLQDAMTGEVLLAIDADEPRYPASLTKMMTLYLTFEALRRGTIRETTPLRVSRHAASMEPSKLWLRAGSTIRVRDAVMALVTKSANDAAVTLAERIGRGSEAQFAAMMTRRARALGMSRTTFRNASGLPHPRQVTTARDMAILSRRLIQDFPDRYAYFSATGFSWRGRHMPNHNRLLTRYDGADGIKTGYIRASGFNLAASAMRDGRRLVAVMFGGSSGQERDEHVMSLLDRGFDELERSRPGGMLMAGRGNGLRLVGGAQASPVLPRPVLSGPALSGPALPGPARPGPRRASRPTSSPVPSPAVTRPARAAPVLRRDWAVQVGAYAERGAARSAARRAASPGGRSEVQRVRVRGRPLWRARVVGLSAAQARNACRAARRGCIVIPGRGG